MWYNEKLLKGESASLMGVLIKSEKIAIMKSAVLNFFNMLLGMKR
jgi:hypothetical protein